MGKMLVSGATGFVGKALRKRMTSNGGHVRGAVRSAEQTARLPAGVEVVQIKSIGADTDWSDHMSEAEVKQELAVLLFQIIKMFKREGRDNKGYSLCELKTIFFRPIIYNLR